jgi:hypothetical protein
VHFTRGPNVDESNYKTSLYVGLCLQRVSGTKISKNDKLRIEVEPVEINSEVS